MSDLAPHASAPRAPIRLCVVVTVDITLLNLCRGRLEYFAAHGFDVTAVCAPTPRAAEIRSRGVRLFTLPLHRTISPWSDVQAVWKLARLLRKERVDIVEASTPKGALIGVLAARLAGVPCIIHLLRGLAYQGQSGHARPLLRRAQWVACRLSHQTISISPSLMQQAIVDRLCRPDRICVLGEGSSNGVDLARFGLADPDRKRAVREDLGIAVSGIVAGFVGRMTRDKGLVELIRAFEEIAPVCPDLHLLLVGDYEHRDRPPDGILETIASHDRIHHAGWREETAPLYAAMDYIVLPTHREGFGTVLLEAAASGLAGITTDIVGARDAVEPGRTALIVKPGDSKALAVAMKHLAADSALRSRMGESARRRVEQHFDQEIVWSRQEAAFRSLLSARRSP